MPKDCWRERTPELVRAPPESERPVPVRSVKYSEPIPKVVVWKLVVVAWVVVERVMVRSVKEFLPVKLLESVRRVDEAAVVIELQPKVPPLQVRAWEALLQVARLAPKYLVDDA